VSREGATGAVGAGPVAGAGVVASVSAATVTFPGRRGAGAGAGAFVLAIVTAGALAHVALRIKGLEVAYELGRERRIGTELEEQRRQLQLEIGVLKDPGRMVTLAREKLKMGPPAPEAIRSVSALRWRVPAAPTVVPLPARSQRPAVQRAPSVGKPPVDGKPAAEKAAP